MKAKGTLRPMLAVKEWDRVCPTIKRDVPAYRKLCREEGYEWPSYCLLPRPAWDGVAQLVMTQGLPNAHPMEQAKFASELGCLMTWYYTQSVYRFDPDLANAIYDTELDREIPTEVLLHLPEWCIYVELPEPKLLTPNNLVHGFWAMLEFEPLTKKTNLVTLFDGDQYRIPHHLELDTRTTLRQLLNGIVETYKQRYSSDKAKCDAIRDSVRGAWEMTLPPLLYLCSQEPDIIDRDEPDWDPRSPRPKKKKKGECWLTPPSKPRFMDVGAKIGEQLRAASAPGDGTKTVRSHLRRAHWHSFWTGPRKNPKPGEQKIVLRWLSPILVQGRDEHPDEDA